MFQISGDVVEIRHLMLLLNFHMFLRVKVTAPGVTLDLSAQEAAVGQERMFICEDLVTPAASELWKTKKKQKHPYILLLFLKYF